LLFYHPAIWIISNLIRKERENCCDARVLNRVGDPLNYAKALVHLAEKQQFSRLMPGTMGTNRNHFKLRIYRILNRDTMKTNLRDRAVSLALLAGSALILMVVNSFSAAPSFITSGKMLSEINTIPEDQSNGAMVDTIPQFDRNNEKEEILEEMDAIDWEKLKAEVEEARMNALEQIEEVDWEKIKAEMEEARMNALEQIEEVDWEKMKAEMEVARREALEEIKEIDWEKLKAEIEEARREALEEIKEIDWEKMKAEIEDARREALEQIDEIDWDEIRNDLKKSRVFNDSVRNEIDQ
jgi:hypothetical protein